MAVFSADRLSVKWLTAFSNVRDRPCSYCTLNSCRYRSFLAFLSLSDAPKNFTMSAMIRLVL
jgi:hypothetical protein